MRKDFPPCAGLGAGQGLSQGLNRPPPPLRVRRPARESREGDALLCEAGLSGLGSSCPGLGTAFGSPGHSVGVSAANLEGEEAQGWHRLHGRGPRGGKGWYLPLAQSGREAETLNHQKLWRAWSTWEGATRVGRS